MGKAKAKTRMAQRQLPPGVRFVPSLLDAMVDGNEYGSIVSCIPSQQNLVPEVQRALREIEAIRGRPCLCYVANLVKDNVQETAIHASDHLPFSEMVQQVPADKKGVDIYLATPGGSGEQVNLFVEELRPRFDEVDFLIPYKAMSAGTLWALSGDRIWMDSRAFLGPVDPQVPSKDGTFVPAQALLTLLDEIQRVGQGKLANGQQPPWSHLQLLAHMDQRQLGAALTATRYVKTMVAQYLQRYKFRSWTEHHTHNPGAPVSDADRTARSEEVAEALSSYDRWKAHGHAISRDVLWKEIRIKIDQPESIPGLQRAIRRLWALLVYIFDKASVQKMICSTSYAFVRTQVAVTVKP